MIKSEERIQNIKEYILEFQFTYHRTPTMAQIAEAVGTVKSNVYKYQSTIQSKQALNSIVSRYLVMCPAVCRNTLKKTLKNMCLCLWHCSGREIFSFCGQADTL